MTYHSPLSASGMERWTACPGSYTLIKSLPGSSSSSSKSSKHAVKGTLMHEIASGIKYNISPITVDGYETEITKEMKDNVKYYTNFLDSIDKRSDCIFSAKELSFSIPYINPHFSGTIDFVAVAGETLHIVDLKTGNKKVKIEDNLQLRYYALGALYWLKDRAIIKDIGGPYANKELEVLTRRTGNAKQNVKWVSLTIFQTNSSGAEIRTERLPLPRITQTFKDFMLESMRICENPEAKLVVNPGCFFCPANRVCPVYNENKGPKFEVWHGE